MAEAYEAFKECYFAAVFLDFSRCNTFETNLAAPLGAIRALLTSRGNEVVFRAVPHEVQTVFRKNQFFFDAIQEPRPEVLQTIVPFRRFASNEDRTFVEYLDKNLFALRGLVDLDQPSRKQIQRSLLEIFQNATAHAESKVGVFACGQLYAEARRIAFTIADVGIGFRGSLGRAGRTYQSDIDAVRDVVLKQLTSRTKLTGGLGLLLLRRFVEEYKGSLEIVTHSGYWRFQDQSHDFSEMKRPFPGTLVNIEFRLKN